MSGTLRADVPALTVKVGVTWFPHPSALYLIGAHASGTRIRPGSAAIPTTQNDRVIHQNVPAIGTRGSLSGDIVYGGA